VGASCAVQSVPVFHVIPTQVTTFKNFRLAGSSYFDIGSALLPFIVTYAQAMLVADHIRVDVFDVGADPKSGSVGPSEVARPQNSTKYTHQSWSEARRQLHSVCGLLVALLEYAHPVHLSYG
jgi:hypothetical protein